MAGASSFILDPTVLFVVGCLAVSPVMHYLENPPNFQDALIAYFLDPAMISGFVTLFFALAITGKWKKLIWSTERLAIWFLINGAFIHVTMDGLTGGYHFLDLLNRHYCKLDRRFLTDEATSWLITQIELFIMTPLCIFTFRAIAKQLPSRYPLIIITSTFQLLGAIFFFCTEIINNFQNVPIDRNLEFTFNHLLYFWFGYMANLIWVVIPVAIIFNAFNLATAGLAIADKVQKEAASKPKNKNPPKNNPPKSAPKNKNNNKK